MNKEQKIIDAWGNNLPIEGVDENGWSNESKWYESYERELYDTLTTGHGFVKIRPAILKGIENNNGWIKIENEEQYNELENGEYEWWNINTGRYEKSDLWEYGCFTHYKIVVRQKPEPPIY